jgi:DNA-binding CsgD family transcriptional regulator
LNRAYGNLASIFLDTGRLEDAAALMFDCAAVGEDLWGMRLNGATGNGVDALVRLGRYSDAEQVLAQIGTNALGVCAPGPWTLPAPMMIRRGRFDVAEDMIATARQMTAHLGDVQQTAFVLGQAAELDLERGRPDDAARAIEQALEVAGRTEDEILLPELYMWGARAIVDQGEAARTYGRALDLAALKRRCDEIVVASNAILANLAARQAEATPRTRAADAQARAERSRLDVSDSVLWLEAASRWELALEVYPQAYCLWRAAEALLKGRVGRSEAAECLNSAWRISRRLHAEPLAARIANLAERGRIELMDDGDTRDTSDVPADLGLTPREVEILGELAAGRSDRQISESLFISKKTVSVHVSNVLRKLDAANRVEAGRIGQAHGLRPSAN